MKISLKKIEKGYKMDKVYIVRYIAPEGSNTKFDEILGVFADEVKANIFLDEQMRERYADDSFTGILGEDIVINTFTVQ